MKGSMVIDEIILPIVDIRLTNGQVEYVAESFGPLPAVEAHRVTIHDREGRVVVAIDLDVTPIRWNEVHPGTSVTVILPFHWNQDRRASQSGRAPTGSTR